MFYMNNQNNSNELQNALNLISVRNDFYLRNYRLLIISNLLAIILICLLIGFAYYQLKSTSGSRYFPSTSSGVLLDMPPLNVNHLKLSNLLTDNKGFLLDQSNINIKDLNTEDPNNALVLYWVKQAIYAMHDYDYINYRRTLQDLRNYFAPGAHEAFLQALDISKNLETIKNNMCTVRVEIINEPVVKTSGIASGRYAWQIFVPIDIYFENIKDPPLIQKVLAKVWVVRVSTLQSPFFGLSIVLFNLEPRI